MNKAKVQKNINNLKKIKEIIEISKFDTLQKLQSATKISDTYLEMALSAKGLLDFANETYRVGDKKPKDKNKSTLWVYVTPDSELMSVSNTKFEKIINNGFDRERDSIIVLGSDATNFATKQKLNIAFSAETSSGYEDNVATSISTSINLGMVTRVKFVINSSKVIDEAINIFPINELNIKTKNMNLEVDKGYKFFPSIVESLKSLTQIYIYRIVFALIKEAQYYHLKEKLIRHEGSIKSVDAKIEEKTRAMNKLIRKNETEDLILVSQIAKRGSDE